jgi:predicted MFS family arabinose efflux permease
MLITILALVIALVAWSLHLMQQAVDRREFSLMLAGTLVAFSAAAMVAVYFLMGNYIGYVSKMAHTSTVESSLEAVPWVWESEADAIVVMAPSWQTATRLEP